MARICVCCDAGADMTPFFNETHQVSYRGLVADVEGKQVRLSANAAVAVTLEEEGGRKAV